MTEFRAKSDYLRTFVPLAQVPRMILRGCQNWECMLVFKVSRRTEVRPPPKLDAILLLIVLGSLDTAATGTTLACQSRACDELVDAWECVYHRVALSPTLWKVKVDTIIVYDLLKLKACATTPQLQRFDSSKTH